MSAPLRQGQFFPGQAEAKAAVLSRNTLYLAMQALQFQYDCSPERMDAERRMEIMKARNEISVAMNKAKR